jgi:mannosyltransferase
MQAASVRAALSCTAPCIHQETSSVKALLLVVAVAALLRLGLAARQDLWADELFSVAVATGHSLEHPAADAVPALGDFVEPPLAVPPAEFRRYLELDTPPAGPGRVIRAVLLSDTSPPLYYLMLAAWVRMAGTSDFAVHACSVLWALATMPLIWLLGRRLGGTREALAACILFAVAPVSLYYSVEARMYAMLWFESALAAWLTLRLHDRGGMGALMLWTLTGAAGLLTHYFFAFVWLACVLWLAVRPGRCPRRALAGAVLVVVALVAPWFRLVPMSLGRWRVTGHWLDGLPPPGRLVTAAPTLAWALLSGRGAWGGVEWVDRIGAVLVLALGLALLRRGRTAVVGNGRDLIWLWAIAVCTGPVVFDLLRGTSTSLIGRYALAGMPAGMLLVGFALGTLRTGVAAAALALLAATWAPGLRDMIARRTRAWEPYRQVAAALGAWARPGDFVLVHSIPSGVLGIARYLDGDVPMAAWVGQLGSRRVPEDLEALLAGRDRVALVRIHDVGEPAPEEGWLRANARLIGERRFPRATVVYFAVPSTRR